MWDNERCMTFAEFSQHLEKLESTSSRLAMTELLVALFRQLDEQEVAPVCYLLQGRLVPLYESLEFQLSAKMVLRAVSRVHVQSEVARATNLFGESVEEGELAPVEKLFKQLGDVGLVAEQVVDSNLANADTADNRPSMSVLDVYQALVDIANEHGSGSQERKLEKLVALLRAIDGLSARYCARIIIGKLRLGFSTMTMLDALSWLASGDKRWTAKLESAWEKRADLGQIASLWIAHTRQPALTAGQVEDQQVSLEQHLQSVLDSYTAQVGVPVMPALCQRLNSAAEIIDKLGTVIAEPKYDGLRLQIHLWHDDAGAVQIRAFSRSLENMTHMFPELQTLPKLISCQSCILDCEAIGFDPTTGELKAFQETITRKRKHAVAAQAEEVPIRFYLFDILELDGRTVVDVPLDERKLLLQTLFNFSSVSPPTKQSLHRGSFYLTPYIVTNDATQLHQFHEVALAEGLEGAVMKQIDSAYQSGRKGWRWVKIKESEGSQGKLADTLDVVVMGYYRGRGKRTQFGLGAVLTGILNQQGEVVTVGKIGTGMSEEQLVELKTLADQLHSPTKPPQYGEVDKTLEPDGWLIPNLVIEVAADELTTSPVHSAGVALRFPRLIRIRSDKTWEQVTRQAELAAIGR